MRDIPEVEDWPTRNAIEMIRFSYERIIWDLLNDDADKALAYLELARQRAFDYIKNLGSETFSMDEEMKSARIAIAVLEESFEGLIRLTREEADDKGSPAADGE